MKVERLTVGELDTNCYLIVDEKSGNTIIIDPGAEYGLIRGYIADNNLNPIEIVLTHSHCDHILAAPRIREEFDIPVSIHKLDAPNLMDPNLNFSAYFAEPINFEADIILENDHKWLMNSIPITAIHTPGHSSGSITLDIGGSLIVGDLIFKSGIGRTDLPGSSMSDFMNALKEKLLTLPGETIVWPGHDYGARPSSTIEAEARTNPWLF